MNLKNVLVVHRRKNVFKTRLQFKKYLWNYEVIKDSKGNTINSTDPCIIGAYGDKGSQGNAGKGISSITNYYLVSANNTGIVNTSDDWETTPQTTDATNKYLWNYELITYTDGTTNTTDPCIIGTHGEKGQKGNKGDQGDQGYGIVASVSRPSFTESQWETYGEVGRTETWSDTSSIRNGCRIGDIFTVNGTATDTKNAHVLYFRSTTNSGELTGTCLSHSIAERGATGSSGNTVVTTAYYYKTSASNYSTKPTSTTISNGTWTTNQLTPDKDNPYVYTSSVTKTNNNFTSATNPVKHSTLDGLVSLLSHGDVNLVTATKGSDDKYTYTLNADKLQGAMSDEVTVGGFTIDSSSIYKDKSSLDTSGSGIYIGTDGIRVGDGFKVTKDGTVTIGYVDTALEALNTDVGTATSNAASALSTANTASTNATNAADLASSANTAATNAATDASSAKTIAGEAKTTAEGAKTVADGASSVATTASNNASSALTQAGEAKTTADTAKSEADKANKAVLKINGDIEAINANFEKITTGELAAGKIEVKDGSNNIVFKADSKNREVKIGDFYVAKDYIYSGDLQAGLFDKDTDGVYIGTDGIRVGDGFRVTSSGVVTLTGFNFSNDMTDSNGAQLSGQDLYTIINHFGNLIQGNQHNINTLTQDAGEKSIALSMMSSNIETLNNNQTIFQTDITGVKTSLQEISNTVNNNTTTMNNEIQALKDRFNNLEGGSGGTTTYYTYTVIVSNVSNPTITFYDNYGSIPSSSVTYLDYGGYTKNKAYILVAEGTSISWGVSASGYQDEINTVFTFMYQNEVKTVTLTKSPSNNNTEA